MALPVILQLVEKHKLTSILKQSAASAMAQNGEDVSGSLDDIFDGSSDMMDASEPATAQTKNGRSDDVFADSSEDSRAESFPEADVRSDAKTAQAPADSSFGEIEMEPEVVIEIVDRGNGGKKRRVVIPKASPWLLEMLADDTQTTEPAAVGTSLRKSFSRETTSTRAAGQDVD